ncbi:BTAD domain-containing putative transcriptional regulator [Streptomyces goshikiensis]|uniref:AfsR/SARP family transcriptional regulator n=1 Tax=Streptomyces goshikiensis TaxID=1942 RepID=UPI0036CD2D8A
MLKFGVLGPLEIISENEEVALTPPRQKTVLSLLLLEANQLMPISRLVEAVWGDRPPATARTQIHFCISTLRKTFDVIGSPYLIETLAPGYRVRIGDDQLDLHRFDSLARRAQAVGANGRPWEASELLGKALAMWRGQALADVDSSLVQAISSRLSERRILMTEERVAYDLELNRHAHLADELVSLTAEFPLRERLQAQLMAALYGSGRRSAALETYRRIRMQFVAELGIEPGKELQDIHQEILKNEYVPTISARCSGLRRPVGPRNGFPNRGFRSRSCLPKPPDQ